MVEAPQTPTVVSLREQTIGAETVIFVGPAVLVKSKSRAGEWWIVEAGECSCPGFVYHGHCRHTAVAKIAEDADHPVCSDCGQRWPMVDGACTAVKGAC